ncbi:hypothetical protein HDV01_002079 [Terramyces sp. JEL0728]|nr:hypothetical protein HDV01_002079 [Terramyces sp. JEL0728]
MWTIDFSNRLDISTVLLVLVLFSAAFYGIGAIYEYYDGEKAHALELKVVLENIERMRKLQSNVSDSNALQGVHNDQQNTKTQSHHKGSPKCANKDSGQKELPNEQRIFNKEPNWPDKVDSLSEEILFDGQKKNNELPSHSPSNSSAMSSQSKFDRNISPFEDANAPPKIITNMNRSGLSPVSASDSPRNDKVKSILKRKTPITSENVLDHLPPVLALPFRTVELVFDKATDASAFIIQKTVISPVINITSIFRTKRKHATCKPNLNRRASFSDGQPYPKILSK